MTNAITFPSSQITQPCQSIQLGESAEYPFASSQSDKSLLTSTDLTAYLSNPTSERTAIIQSWVCNLVQDDGFLQLCEDVEGAWGRIALGKRADQFNWADVVDISSECVCGGCNGLWQYVAVFEYVCWFEIRCRYPSLCFCFHCTTACYHRFIPIYLLDI